MTTFRGAADWLGGQAGNAANWLQDPIHASEMMGAAQALLGASGWSKTPTTFGQALGAGIGGYQQGEAQGLAMQEARRKAEINRQLNDLILGTGPAMPGGASGMLGNRPDGGAVVEPTGAAAESGPTRPAPRGAMELLSDPRFQSLMMLRDPTTAMQTFGSLAKANRYEPESDLGKALYDREALIARYGADDPRVTMYDQYIDKNVINKPRYKERKRPVGDGLVQTEVSHDDGRTWEPLGPTHYSSNPYQQRTMWDAEGNEYQVPTNVWQQGSSPGAPRQESGGPSGGGVMIDPVAGTRVPQAGAPAPAPATAAPSGLSYRKTKPLTEKEYEGLAGDIKHVGNINDMRDGLDVISGPGTGNVNGWLAEYVSPSLVPDWIGDYGIKVTPESQRFMRGYAGVAATVQSSIPGVPSNFDSKTYLRQLPKPGYSLDTNRLRLDHAERVSKEMLRAKMSYYMASGKALPADLAALAAQQGVTPDQITMSADDYVKSANEMVEQFQPSATNQDATKLEAIVNDESVPIEQREKAMKELEKLWQSD